MPLPVVLRSVVACVKRSSVLPTSKNRERNVLVGPSPSSWLYAAIILFLLGTDLELFGAARQKSAFAPASVSTRSTPRGSSNSVVQAPVAAASITLGAPPTNHVPSVLEGPATISKEIWIGPRDDNQPGDGTIGNPFNGSGENFDLKMRELYLGGVTYIRIHLLAGTYETMGAYAFYTRTGWKINGAGIDVTIVRLRPTFNRPVVVLGTPYWEKGIEVSDLTVDCNYGSDNPNTASAVLVQGTHHTIRRVKAINAWGHFPTAETFILGIGNGSLPSEGNVIEDCEVSSFKGTYCSAIALGSPPGSLAPISGIIRGNHVYDLSSPVGIITGIAYGGGNLKNVLIENNVSFRCATAVNVDTGKSQDVIFRNNQFVECEIGINLVGGDLDNFTLENNFIEVTAVGSSYGITLYDSAGRNRVRNFKIINNTIRSRDGLASPFGGIMLVSQSGPTMTVSGNRVDAKLRSRLECPGAHVFNNTDFLGNPLALTENSRVTPVDLPRGQTGTLLLDKGEAYVVVTPGTNPEENGRKLTAAYQRVAATQPHGQALSPANRAGLILLPGTYRLADSALVLNTRYVDLTGAGGAQGVRLESDGNVLVQTAPDVVLENLTLHCSSTTARLNNDQDKSAYHPASNLINTTIKNCTFSASQNGLCMRLGVTYAGHYENCRSGDQSWGGPGNFSGSAISCQAGAYSFGSTGWFMGTATNCTAGERSFGGAASGSGGFHGAAKNCSAGHASFGGSGVMINCEVAGAVSPGIPTTGKLTDCRIGPAPGNDSAIFIGPGAVLYNCTLLANPGGNGFSVAASAPVAAKIAHCRLNHGMHNVLNLIQQPANVDELAVE